MKMWAAVGRARRFAGGMLGRGVEALLAASDRIQVPGPAVLPMAGVVVGLYGGLSAGVFTNLVALVSGIFVSWPRLVSRDQPFASLASSMLREIRQSNWHVGYAVIGLCAAAAALLASRIVQGEARVLARKRLKLLGLLLLGALSLYYPLRVLAVLNRVLSGGRGEDALGTLPWWAVLLTPALGGLIVGRLLQSRPDMRGHGLPEVITAVRLPERSLSARSGVLKLVASAFTLGTGGSAGREGPIAFGAAAICSTVGHVLGFSRRELAILVASGAGAGISASFNAPIAGAVFAMEVILREFEVKVISPILLASVTATMVGRGLMGAAPMIRRFKYQLASGWDMLAYAVLGVVVGALAFALLRLLHRSEAFFDGHGPSKLSARLGRSSLSARAAVGGFLTGALALVTPAVWSTGHQFVNLAAAGKLTLGFLLLACALKLVSTAVTIGSGGSGGTLFPAMVVGAMAGGAFAQLLAVVVPGMADTSSAYAVVGMGGAVAGITRGPLTGMMMIYELSGSYVIILPLMVTCAIASAVCHHLHERSDLPARQRVPPTPAAQRADG